MPDPFQSTMIHRYEGDSASEQPDLVAREEPLEIRVEGSPVALVMRTPGHDEELTAGFLLTEGIITSASDIFEISACPSQQDATEANAIDVILTDRSKFDPKKLTRHVFTSSSCGICGKATLDSVFTDFPKIENAPPIDPTLIQSLPDKLRAAQETFEKTGGLHASGLFTNEGELLALREDVGRHNALDKILGYAIQNNLLPLSNHILLLSGRVSFELMQKSLAGGIPTIAAVSAPSSLAVDFAKESGQTLIGFLRGERMNVYTG